MSKISTEYLTMLSGALALIDGGFIKEAEEAYQQLWTLARRYGNDDEKEIALQGLKKFLRSRGRSEEIESLSMESESQIYDQPVTPATVVKDVIVIGSSAGGVEPVCVLLNGLPSDLNAAVFIVQQTPGHSPSELAEMLNQRSKIPVAIPKDGETIMASHVYLAPPNQHLVIKNGSICLGNGPKENRARPAIDVLFRTAAHAYGTHVIGVLVSGVLNDGTSGLMSIKTHGGKSIVQDPAEAVFDAMPRSAIAFTNVDYIVKAALIGPLLQSLIAGGVGDEEGVDGMPEYRDEADIGEVGGPGINYVAPYPPSALTCPACGGAVWEIQEESLKVFKCHTGHSYTAELMLEEQSEAVDSAAWSLLRSIAENIELRRRLAQWARASGRDEEAAFHEQQANDADKQALAFRQLILSNQKGRD